MYVERAKRILQHGYEDPQLVSPVEEAFPLSLVTQLLPLQQ